MGMSDDGYLFDVGIVALGHAGTPVSEPALHYVREAISGELTAFVPHPVLIGAHHTLVNVYRFSNAEAGKLMRQFRDARRIHWYADCPEGLLRNGFTIAGKNNIDGWDGYYAAVARELGVETILTLDDDFTRLDGIDCEIPLDSEQFQILSDYIETV